MKRTWTATARSELSSSDAWNRLLTMFGWARGESEGPGGATIKGILGILAEDEKPPYEGQKLRIVWVSGGAGPGVLREWKPDAGRLELATVHNGRPSRTYRVHISPDGRGGTHVDVTVIQRIGLRNLIALVWPLQFLAEEIAGRF